MKVKIIPALETAISKLISHTLDLNSRDRSVLKTNKDRLGKYLEEYKQFVIDIDVLKDEWHEVGESSSDQQDRANSLADRTSQVVEQVEKSMKSAKGFFP